MAAGQRQDDMQRLQAFFPATFPVVCTPSPTHKITPMSNSMSNSTQSNAVQQRPPTPGAALSPSEYTEILIQDHQVVQAARCEARQRDRPYFLAGDAQISTFTGSSPWVVRSGN